MNPKLEATLQRAIEALKTELGANLYSCCVYGSAVRGNAVDGVSDLNLLIVLNESNSAAHQAVSRALEPFPVVDPFVLAKTGFERSVRAFAPKFASIRRHHRVLHGADPLAGIKIDTDMERFLCEQTLRNLRLRLVYSFITRHQHHGYDRFLLRSAAAMFVQFSEVLRLDGATIPADFAARVPLFESEFKIDGKVLLDLLALKRSRGKFSDTEATAWHDRVFPVIDAVVRSIELRWPK